MRAIAFLVALLALPVMAAEPAASMSSAGMGAQLSKLLFGLLLVIGFIFLLAWLLRRVQQMNPRGTQVIKLISSQALGPRERLVLVQVGGEQILIGLSGGRITPLHVMQEPVHLPDAEPANPEFAQRLMELLGKDHKDRP
ncbi:MULTISPECIES: flagellar biosynthetic protein FliO [Stutzerimonas stutzeri subgroup]|jgi:flagellar protein FliO/FliZ|uniref:Flagellar protein n=1 Tax=Stutzerimonas stutzeri TaxID=316 RepID=A0A2N8RJR1_STUST|nr:MULTISPECIES: flagellar biosynthetic protein FliO [Stutzerimonas stutzeri subgroup]KRW68115.1 flagellar assembly protein FliO [Pseudomonas sp. TTU2014-105ASC]MDH2241075.1 flagellar biosynthetic protein FliO [Pseudomonas sp. GD03909]MDH2245071.1 flagellar biosynthetic protein FliO [Pseudomonas sp. GD03856]MDH2263700.1 flagellar biosynthetic protein FliO [Pseudomonas sp. GD03855]EHY76216.1 flagellar protein FliO [Stutzerimonas stutzeri ATCC 14405 = CCUG 16156]